MSTEWHDPSTAPDGVDVLVWRQDSFRKDNLYGCREVAMYDAEADAWYGSDGDEIGQVRLWTALPDKPTPEQLAGAQP